MTNLSEQRSEFIEHKLLLHKALSEIRSSFVVASQAPEKIECPVCGADYHNSIIERFGLIENEDSLLAASIEANENVKKVEKDINHLETTLNVISGRIYNIELILKIRKQGITFRDVVAAEGRNEASRIFKERLSIMDREATAWQTLIREKNQIMADFNSKSRAKRIKNFFSDRLNEFAARLDVRSEEIIGKPSINGNVSGRGSEKPRALLAYYYAFIHTASEYGSSTLFPIVLDAPNQQGQDDEHMPTVMAFIADSRPINSQVIVACEKLFGMKESAEIDIFDLGSRKYQVLQEDQYDEVFEKLRPLIGNLL